MEINFTIKGNHSDPYGNPLPKNRLTYAQQWTPQAKKYVAWKNYVMQCYMEAAKIAGLSIVINDALTNSTTLFVNGRTMKPLNIMGKSHMYLKIYWANNVHGDPENIFGSIADALFVNDKNLDGCFESQMSPDKKGRVDVTIMVPDSS
jgi:hypothetical protein